MYMCLAMTSTYIFVWKDNICELCVNKYDTLHVCLLICLCRNKRGNYSLQYLNEWFSRFPISMLSCLLSSNTEKSISFLSSIAYNYPRSSWFIGVFLTIYAYYNVDCLISAFSLICDSYSIFWNTYRLGNECTNISLILYKYIF